jgi:hypothetical protein
MKTDIVQGEKREKERKACGRIQDSMPPLVISSAALGCLSLESCCSLEQIDPSLFLTGEGFQTFTYAIPVSIARKRWV